MVDPVGKLYLHPRGETVVQVTAVSDEPWEFDKDDRLITFVDLRDGEEHGGDFLSEIGEEFIELPGGYGREWADAYCKAANQREEANTLMHDIEMDVMLDQGKGPSLYDVADELWPDDKAFAASVCDVFINGEEHCQPLPEDPQKRKALLDATDRLLEACNAKASS